MKITLSEHPQKRKRLLILIDDEPWKEVDLIFFTPHIDTLQQCTSLPMLQETFAEIEMQKARNYAIRRLGQQSFTKKALARALSLRAISPSTTEKVLSECEKQGYINDEQWSASFIRQQVAKKMGPRAIAQKLAVKGVERQLIDASLSDLGDQSSLISSLLKTKYRNKNLADRKERGSVIASLIRRGFPFEEIITVMGNNYE